VGDAKNLGLQEQRKHILQRPGCASTRNSWADIEWLWCADGKARPTKSGLFPLANGISGRMAVGMSGAEAAANGGELVHEYNRNGALRGIGNAIVPQVAAEFIREVMSEMDSRMGMSVQI
jgi:DNA (cytosine-5)-methyltransferase 1